MVGVKVFNFSSKESGVVKEVAWSPSGFCFLVIIEGSGEKFGQWNASICSILP
jgi:hypothetical protein